MASRVAAEVAADAILIGRYFGSSTTTSTLATAAASASTSAALARATGTASEGDGPGVRMMASSTGGGMSVLNMSSPGAAGAGSVRFMSMFGGNTTATRKHAAVASDPRLEQLEILKPL